MAVVDIIVNIEKKIVWRSASSHSTGEFPFAVNGTLRKQYFEITMRHFWWPKTGSCREA